APRSSLRVSRADLTDGAPGGAAPGRQASQTCRIRGARARGRASQPRPRTSARGPPDRKGGPKGVSQTPWRLPALHSLFGAEEKGTPACPRRSKNRADDARPQRIRLPPLTAPPEN